MFRGDPRIWGQRNQRNIYRPPTFPLGGPRNAEESSFDADPASLETKKFDPPQLLDVVQQTSYFCRNRAASERNRVEQMLCEIAVIINMHDSFDYHLKIEICTLKYVHWS